MDKSYWFVVSFIFLMVMVVAIIIKDQELTSTSLICCMISQAVVDLHKKK